MDDKFFDGLIKRIQPYFEEKGSHDFNHTERVYNLAIMIAKGRDVDMDVVRAATLLHDIARKKQEEDFSLCHAEEGAKMARKVLTETDFPKDKIEKVVHAVEVHRYSKKLKAESKEAEILQDADRLDALGAITIARVFDWGAKKDRAIYDPKIVSEEYGKNHISNTSMNHFHEKILKIKPNTFKTKKAREMAKERYEYVEGFVERFKKEWEGKL
jgi:uncharacterized protein